MSAATKVTVAIVVLFAAVLGIYYGFGGPDGAGPAPNELLPPAEEDTNIDGSGVDAKTETQEPSSADTSLAESIEEALWAQGGPTTTGALGSDGVAAVTQPDDPWVLRAPTLMPEPETRSTPGTATPAPARTVEYVVQSGDSMWTISKRWFGDANRWREIARGNPNINAERLTVGQRLQLPARDDTGPVGMNRAISIPRSQVPATGRYYTVRSGDTLSTIAEKHYRSESRWRDIYNANRSAIGGNPDRLQVGMKLRIP